VGNSLFFSLFFPSFLTFLALVPQIFPLFFFFFSSPPPPPKKKNLSYKFLSSYSTYKDLTEYPYKIMLPITRNDLQDYYVKIARFYRSHIWAGDLHLVIFLGCSSQVKYNDNYQDDIQFQFHFNSALRIKLFLLWKAGALLTRGLPITYFGGSSRNDVLTIHLLLINHKLVRTRHLCAISALYTEI